MDASSGISWWGIIITIIVILVIVIIATVVVHQRQSARKAYQQERVLDLSGDKDSLIAPQIMSLMDSLSTTNSTISQDDLATLIYQQFSALVPAEKLQLVNWDSRIMIGMKYNHRCYTSEEKDHVWDLRGHLGIPLLIIARDKPTEELVVPNTMAVAQLSYLINNGLVNKAHSLIDEMLTHRRNMLRELDQSPGWTKGKDVVSGYWWVEPVAAEETGVFISATYPKGVLAHGGNRINLLCATADFDRLLDICEAYLLEKQLSEKK